MKLLLQIEERLQEYLLLEISDEGKVIKIKTLFNEGKSRRAKDLALSKGNFLGIYKEHEIADIDVELIISSSNLHRDLTGLAGLI